MSAGSLPPDSIQHFFAMGGYAGYLWPAYAIFFIVLLADFLAPALRRRRLLRDLRTRMARNAARQQRSTSSTSSDSL